MPTRFSKGINKFSAIFFDLLYNQFAWAYDLVSATVSIGMWNNWIREILPYLKGPIILELGHGPGHLQKALSANTSSSFGLDLSPQMGRLAAHRLRKIGKTPKLVNASAQKLPFSDNTFNQVAATFPTEYIVARNSINEIFRVLNPGGKLVIIPLAWITGKKPIHKAAAWLFKITGQGAEPDVDQFSKRLVVFEQVGFNLNLERKVRKHSTVIIVTANKPLE